MGTDIHGVFQRLNHETKVWEDIAHEFGMNRHYQLFAVLAGVRNGVGFAGVKTGEAVTPIAAPRGYPDGFVSRAFSTEDECEADDLHPVADASAIDPRSRGWRSDGDPLHIWMGDHSHSWLDGDEMLDWFAKAPTVIKTGVIGKKQYEAWDGKSSPDSWCGDISGGGVVVIDDNSVARETTANWTHIRIEWQSSLSEELAYFFDEVRRLKAEYGTVRFVFGFDS